MTDETVQGKDGDPFSRFLDMCTVTVVKTGTMPNPRNPMDTSLPSNIMFRNGYQKETSTEDCDVTFDTYKATTRQMIMPDSFYISTCGTDINFIKAYGYCKAMTYKENIDDGTVIAYKEYWKGQGDIVSFDVIDGKYKGGFIHSLQASDDFSTLLDMYKVERSVAKFLDAQGIASAR